MAEIKSTLELVMEKTRNLKLSREEKQEQENKEIESRIRGLIQKFQDQVISADRFKSEYRILQEENSLAHNEPLIKVIFSQIELGKDNQALFELLSQFKTVDIEGITSVLQEFQTVLDAAAGQRRKTLKDQLAKTHFISGSAVVANLQNDDEWRKEAGKTRAKFEKLLNEAKTNNQRVALAQKTKRPVPKSGP